MGGVERRQKRRVEGRCLTASRAFGGARLGDAWVTRASHRAWGRWRGRDRGAPPPPQSEPCSLALPSSEEWSVGLLHFLVSRGLEARGRDVPRTLRPTPGAAGVHRLGQLARGLECGGLWGRFGALRGTLFLPGQSKEGRVGRLEGTSQGEVLCCA